MQNVIQNAPKEFFLAVDMAFGRTLAYDSEEQTFFLAYLLKAAREGHLCVQINDDVIVPQFEDFIAVPQGHEKILKGAKNYQGEAVVKYGDLFYLQRNWIKETVCLEEFLRIVNDKPDFIPNIEQTDLSHLLPEQAAAIKACLNSSLTILTGGPGTGKTFTAGHMLKTLLGGLSQVQKGNFEIALTAPTGKAAANLQKSIATVLKEENIVAKTLHTLLKIRKKHVETVLSADLILVDECSMIDTSVMATLLKAVKPGARLILLGDKNQLPSVDVGSVFANIVDFIQGSPLSNSKCIELKKCMRAELQGIVQFSQQIKEGQLNLNQAFEGIERVADDYLLQSKKFVEWIASQFKIFGFSQFRVLSPMRKGPWGIDSLNKQIYNQLKKRHFSNAPMEVPIMITRNDEDTGLYNGDVGILHTQSDVLAGRFDAEDMAMMEGREIPALLLPSFELAYCISIHKSQGSEFSKIVLVLPEGSEQFGREVFYTAVTRARRSISLLATNATLQATLSRPSLRLSGLPQRLLK